MDTERASWGGQPMYNQRGKAGALWDTRRSSMAVWGLGAN